jgi:hypothetical protein
MLEWKIYSAVVNHGERPCLELFETRLAALSSEAERQAVQQYMALMQRCWDADPVKRPRFKEVWRCCLLACALLQRSPLPAVPIISHTGACQE